MRTSVSQGCLGKLPRRRFRLYFRNGHPFPSYSASTLSPLPGRARRRPKPLRPIYFTRHPGTQQRLHAPGLQRDSKSVSSRQASSRRGRWSVSKIWDGGHGRSYPGRSRICYRGNLACALILRLAETAVTATLCNRGGEPASGRGHLAGEKPWKAWRERWRRQLTAVDDL